MALNSKRSRRIVVDGDTYRWRVRRKPGYSQGLGQSPLTFAVEDAAAPGTTLVVRTAYPHTGNWFGLPSEPVLPSDVARAVRIARREGWAPRAGGSPFILGLSDATAGPSPQPAGAA